MVVVVVLGLLLGVRLVVLPLVGRGGLVLLLGDGGLLWEGPRCRAEGNPGAGLLNTQGAVACHGLGSGGQPGTASGQQGKSTQKQGGGPSRRTALPRTSSEWFE